MERSSKPPPDDFPAIGGRGRIDGSIMPAKSAAQSGAVGFVGKDQPLLHSCPISERLNLF